MIFVGIDVASDKHDCFITDSHGEILKDVFTFKNDLSGFKKLHNNLLDVESNDSMRIGLESTGLYHLNLLNFLNTLGYKVQVINPLLTSMARKSHSVRKTKTDKVDAKAICKYLQGNIHDFQPYTSKVYNNEALKSLARQRFTYNKQLSKLKVELYVLISKAFPEFVNFFNDLHSKSSYAILEKYTLPSVIANTRVDGLTNTLIKASQGSHRMSKAIELKTLASDSIGDRSEYYSFQIKITLNTIKFYEEQIKTMEKEIESIIDEHFQHVLTIPGVSYKTAALLLGEIGNINRFNSFDNLLAYFGLDPVVYQSGKYNAENTKASKRGSSYARFALFHISRIIVKHDPTFIRYYEKKRSEGKHYFTVMSHVSKKVLRVIYYILKHNRTFIPQS